MSEPLVALPDTDTLTPTQELVMEVLAARYRLGENTWTFGKRLGPALASLAYDGYIGYKSGVVPNTYLAWMTPAGRAAALDPDYVPPNVGLTGKELVLVLTQSGMDEVRRLQQKRSGGAHA